MHQAFLLSGRQDVYDQRFLLVVVVLACYYVCLWQSYKLVV